jgi:hypothetical protein
MSGKVITALRVACCVAMLALSLRSIASSSQQQPTLLIVVGAAGEEEFGKLFSEWTDNWKGAAQKAAATVSVIGVETNDASTDRELLEAQLKAMPKEGAQELWLVLIGHGTFDGKEAKFNLRGPDVSAPELRGWLQTFRRPLAIINSASASGPFLNALSGSNRVVITATRSGGENNFARFGGYLSKAVADTGADLDKDGQTSLLEAYLTASRQTQQFYTTEGRLATEHALLDDNGDGLGTPAEWFKGIRAVKKPQEGASMDGLRAHQFHLVRSDAEQVMAPEVRAKRDGLELQIAHLRERKAQLREEEYYRQLEALLLDLAALYSASK